MQSIRVHWMAAGIAALTLLAGAQSAGAQENNQPPAGFQALFNGRDLTNWKGLVDIKRKTMLTPDQLQAEQAKADTQMREHWRVQDGVLIYDGKGNSLQTARDYGNFELYVDWRIQPKGDSGIYLRGNPQVQIWDEAAGSAKDQNGNFIGSGGLYNNKNNPSRPLVVADKPAGEWNRFHIKMVGDRVTIHLNDKLVVDNTPLENYWFPGQPLPARGPIELQHHGNTLEFRNIFVRELPDGVAAVKSAPLITLNLIQAPLSEVLQLLSSNGGVEIVIQDPKGQLGKRPIPFVSIKERPLERALELVCRAANVTYSKDRNGVFYVAEER